MSRNIVLAILVAIMIAPTTFSQTDTSMTAGEHTAQALVYERRIVELQAEKVEHRRMKADYARTIPQIPKAPKNPWIVRMDEHCDDVMEQLGVLISEYERMADYHRLRAAELMNITPGTVEEYDARAADYRNRAAEYRKQAAEHRDMRDRLGPRRDPKRTPADSKVNKEMRAHCERIIAAAETLATSSEKLAKLFVARAQELRAK